MKCCLIIIYYGRLPQYTSLFLQSCSFNRNIDFKIFTDIDIRSPWIDNSHNIEVIKFTIADFRYLVKSKAGFNMDSSIHPYKFCDFKPSYGYFFQDFIDSYDYWGYCDIDMIFGDINHWLDYIPLDFDIINSSKYWMHGPFCLFKNTQPINTLFLESQEVTKVFESREYLEFDETSKKNKLRLKQFNFNSTCFTEKDGLTFLDESSCFTSLVYQHRSSLNLYMENWLKDRIANKKDYLIWNQGDLFEKGSKKVFAFHFVNEKKMNRFRYLVNPPEKILITRTGFFDYSQSSVKIKCQSFLRHIKGMVHDMMDILYLIRTGGWRTSWGKTKLKLIFTRQ